MFNVVEVLQSICIWMNFYISDCIVQNYIFVRKKVLCMMKYIIMFDVEFLCIEKEILKRKKGIKYLCLLVGCVVYGLL